MVNKKYNFYVYKAVREFYGENYRDFRTDEEIDKMPRSAVLGAYLNWEGIFGYTNIIMDILNYYDEEDN